MSPQTLKTSNKKGSAFAENFQRDLFEDSLVPMFAADVKGRIVEANAALLDLLGYHRKEISDLQIGDFFPASLNKKKPLKWKSLKAGKGLVLEQQASHKDGLSLPVEVAIRKLSNGSLLGILHDLTKRRQTEEALRESEARLRAIVESEPECVKLLDRDGCVLDMNAAGLRMIEADSLDQVKGKPMLDMVAPEFRDQYQSLVARVFAGNNGTLEFEAIGLKGARCWLDTHAVPLFDSEGRVTSLLAVTRDITERKHFNETLRRQNQYLQALQETTLELISQPQADTLLENIVKRAGQLVGTTSGFLDLVDADTKQLKPQIGIGALAESLRHPVKPGEGLAGTVWQTAKSLVINEYDNWPGRIKDFSRNTLGAIIGVPLVSGGQILGVLGLAYEAKSGKTFEPEAIDILDQFARLATMAIQNTRLFSTAQLELSERRRAEEALKTTEARYRTLVDGMLDGVYRSTHAGRFVDVNPAMVKMFGYESREEMLKVDIKSELYFAPQDRASLFLDTGQEKVEIFRMRRKDGSEVWVEDHGRYVHDEQGNVVFHEGTLRDVTERVHAEQARRESQERYRLLFENAPLGILSITPQGKVLEVNSSALSILGSPSAEATKQINLLTFPPLIQAGITADFQHCVDTCQPVSADRPYTTKWGKNILAHYRLVPIFDERKQLAAVQLIVEDITERKQAEESLHARTRELESLFAISNHLSLVQTEADILPQALQEVERVMSADTVGVFLLEPDQEHIRILLATGAFADNTGGLLPIEEDFSGQVTKTGQPLTTEDYSHDPRRIEDLAGSLELGAAAFVPFQSHDQVIGVLMAGRSYDQEQNPFTPAAIRLLTSIGEMIGTALRRVRLYDQALTRYHRVRTMQRIDRLITTSLDINFTLRILLTELTAMTEVDAACILLLDTHTMTLQHASSYGFHSHQIEETRLRAGDDFAGRAVMERRPQFISDQVRFGESGRARLFSEEGIVAYSATPMIVKGKVVGVLETFHRSAPPGGEEWQEFLNALADQTAIAIDSTQLLANLQQNNFELSAAYDNIIEGWSHALDMRGGRIEGHSPLMMDLTLQLASLFGIANEALLHLRHGALLHDIGYLGIPDRILLKPEKLNEEERKIIQTHPNLAMELLKPIEFLRPALDIPYCHHEKWDGTGYPRGLKGDQIPLTARIFAVVDVYDSLLSARPHRPAWTQEKALTYIREQAGASFDPEVAAAFLDLINTL